MVLASAMLLALFYFMNSIIFVLKCCLLLSSVVAVAFVLWDWVCLLVPTWLALWPTLSVASAVVLVWFATEHWMVMNLIAFCTCGLAVCVIKIRRLYIVLVIAVGFLVYDVWWVFLSPVVFGKSVMVEAARAAAPHMPAVLAVPGEDHASMIGLGDVVLPGIVLDFFMRFDAFHGTALFVVAFCGYCAGVQIAWVAVLVMGKGQPALLWIFPAILLPVTIAAAAQGLLGELWRMGAADANGDIGTDAKSGPDDLVIESSSGDNDAKEKAPQKVNGGEQENGQTKEGDTS
jgi:signal peptide peptidase-like protein 2B